MEKLSTWQNWALKLISQNIIIQSGFRVVSSWLSLELINQYLRFLCKKYVRNSPQVKVVSETYFDKDVFGKGVIELCSG